MASVRARIGVLFLALALLAIGTISVVSRLQSRRIEDMLLSAAERSRTAADIDRITKLRRVKFATFIDDYTWWDELADYVLRPSEQWAVDNIDSSFDAVAADGIWVYRKDLRLVRAVTDPKSKLPKTLPSPISAIAAMLQKAPFAAFWARTPAGLVEVRCGRIHRSNDPNRTGPYTGYLIGAHLWTDEDAVQLGELTECRVRLLPPDPAPEDRAPVGKTPPGFYRTEIPLKDHAGTVVARLELTGQNREVAALATAETRERWTVAALAALLFLLVVLALQIWVARPLQAVSRALAGQTPEPVQSLRQDRGEFGQVARVVEESLSQRAQLEREFAERKAAQEALSASQQWLQSILDTVQSGIMVVDVDTRTVVDANPALLAMARAERSQVVGKPCNDLVCPAQKGACPVADLGQTVDSRETVLIRTDGEQVPVLKSVRPVEIGGKRYHIESVTDITDLKRVQTELAESRQRYFEFFALNPVPCWVYELDTLRFVDVNDAALRQYGYSRAEFLELTVVDLRLGASASELKADLARETGVRHRQAVRYRTRDGRIREVDTTSIPITVNGVPCRLVVAYDVTERMEAERKAEALRRELERSNRELQEFASVASHDLQEPLRKITAFANRLQAKYAEHLPPDATDYLQRMVNAVNRMQTLIEDLLVYSRVTTRAKPFEPTDLNKVLEEVLGDLEARLVVTEGRVEADRLPTIEVDPTQIRQLFQNLIGNALKFRREGVPPVVRITAEDVVQDGRKFCKLTFADNGIGFENEYAERIFGVFERLHGRDQFEGTGMGLAIVRKIATRHGGSVTAEGKPGEGATFTVLLPKTHPEQISG